MRLMAILLYFLVLFCTHGGYTADITTDSSLLIPVNVATSAQGNLVPKELPTQDNMASAVLVSAKRIEATSPKFAVSSIHAENTSLPAVQDTRREVDISASLTTKLSSTLAPSKSFNFSKALENIFGLLSQFSNTGQPQLDKIVEGFIKGATNVNKPQADSKNSSSFPVRGQDIMSLLVPLLPLLSQAGLTDPSKVMSIALSYLHSNIDSLKAAGVSEKCVDDVAMWTEGLATTQGWAWKMLDAGFKIPANVAGFNLKWMGSMEECIAIHANFYKNVTKTMQHFDGKYCRILIPISLPGIGSQMLVLGSCASNHCSNNDVRIMVDTLIEAAAPKYFTSRSIVSCVEDRELDNKAKAVICFLVVLALLVVIGTLYDVIAIQMTWNRKAQPDILPGSYIGIQNGSIKMKEIHENGGYVESESDVGQVAVTNGHLEVNITANTFESIVKEKKRGQRRFENILLAFSVYTNARKMLGTNQGTGSLGAINGIRFLSMAWVILGHSYFFAFNYASNLFEYGQKKVNQYSFMAILFATPSVDSFFALSGTLVAYLTLRELKKVGGAKKLNWVMFYLHRFWRLTPPYMLIIMVGTILYRYLGFGAMSPDGDNPFMTSCRDNWWTNLLYINNYVHTDQMCMGWTWYLANDMQMYIISPLIFLAFFYKAWVGWTASAIFMLATTVATTTIAAVHEYPVQSAAQNTPTKQDDKYNDLMYIPMYTRLGPYIVGLVTGYLLFRCDLKCRIPKLINIGLWLVSIAICTAIIYGPYTNGDSHIMSTRESTVYYALFRTGWGLAVCWIIFACATGNGGWINDVLSWSPFIPLGRMTYCAYLLHPLVIMFYHENRMQSTYFTDYDTIYFFMGNLVLSYGMSFVVSLFFESPMMGLEKALLGKK